MATGWVKSLHCKSNALDDVYQPKTPFPRKPLLPLSTCAASSSQALRDVVFLFPKHPPLPKKPSSFRRAKPQAPPPPPEPQPQTLDKLKQKPRPKNRSKPKPTSPSPPAVPVPPPHSIPTLAELPDGHSSRRVVEIIFSSSWSRRGAPFPGDIEMLFRVHNTPRTVDRFEEYRAGIRSRCASRSGDDARCAADGNEMMRFHCAPSSASAGGADGAAVYDAGVAYCAMASHGGKAVEGIRTFDGSGGAHESGGGGAGRRAMLVCRVIAGRVRGESDPKSEGESVCVGKGEILVFDPRAVLPCFLIIYKV